MSKGKDKSGWSSLILGLTPAFVVCSSDRRWGGKAWGTRLGMGRERSHKYHEVAFLYANLEWPHSQDPFILRNRCSFACKQSLRGGPKRNGGESLASCNVMFHGVSSCTRTPHTGFLGKVVRVSTAHPGRSTETYTAHHVPGKGWGKLHSSMIALTRSMRAQSVHAVHSQNTEATECKSTETLMHRYAINKICYVYLIASFPGLLHLQF